MSNGNIPPQGAMSSPFGKGQFQEALGTSGFDTVGTQQGLSHPFTQEESKVVIESIITVGGKLISANDDVLVIGLNGIILRISKVQ